MMLIQTRSLLCKKTKNKMSSCYVLSSESVYSFRDGINSENLICKLTKKDKGFPSCLKFNVRVGHGLTRQSAFLLQEDE